MGIVERQSIKGTLVSYAGAFIGFLTTFLIITEFLTPKEVGLTRNIVEAATLISSFALLGLNSSAFRFYPYFHSESGEASPDGVRDNGYFYYMMAIALIGGVLMTLLMLLAKGPFVTMFSRNSPELVDFYYSIVPLFVFMLFWSVFELYATQLMRIAVPKLIREVVLRLMLIVVYLLYAFRWVSLEVFIAIFIAAYAACMLLLLAYIRRIGKVNLRHNRGFLTPELKRNFLRYTLFYVVASIGSKLSSRLDLFMVSSLDKGGLDSGGIFSIAFYMVAVVEIPSRSLLSVSSPLMADAMKRNDLVKADELFKRVSLHQLLSGGLIFLLIWFNIDSIFSILPNGHLYAAGKYVVFYLGIAKMIEITLNYGNPIVSCSKYYHWNLYYTFLVTILAVLTNLWLIPVLGINGAAIATLLTTLLSYGVQQFMISRNLHASPFSPALFRLLALFALLFGANALIPHVDSPWLDIPLRSIPIGVGALVAVYAMRLSPEFNRAIDKYLRRR
ncbi:polysaccharide biosynthesis protein [Porphyromonas gingivalis]|uniref:polysaccharide biosynthesis C-terminal domain-containing protein n=1 Tax=Porphyromonas gingivalis TaxID=837 RepID=UPI000B4C3AA7|nr:polysaccharide biosynthesis C-terminal domain-containing protein [Porphyromonas gingivalis]ATR90476.1 polysaccharide biosynthesis protein [Porphyromonas gingivalis]ATR99177.1 polysaccharide biosynthesis protein [Porphyromonas gingivalis]OWP29299.1 polysaccharide biosynthesis protein [Porphyromonas gingivalis]PDP83809.1 polysaccharide biosynthesis protein [Porphyromonas gingivalis]